MSLFGNGWIWLVEDNNKKLQIITLYNAGSPLAVERYQSIDRNITEESGSEELDFSHPQSLDYTTTKRELLATLDYAFNRGPNSKSKKKMIRTSIPTFKPILCISMWEHCYFYDYQNRKQEYLQRYWQQVNWDIVQNYLLD